MQKLQDKAQTAVTLMQPDRVGLVGLLANRLHTTMQQIHSAQEHELAVKNTREHITSPSIKTIQKGSYSLRAKELGRNIKSEGKQAQCEEVYI